MCRGKKILPKVIKNRKWTIFLHVNLISSYIFWNSMVVHQHSYQWRKLENFKHHFIYRFVRGLLNFNFCGGAIWAGVVFTSNFKTFAHSQPVHWCKHKSYVLLCSVYSHPVYIDVYWSVNGDLEKKKARAIFSALPFSGVVHFESWSCFFRAE